MLTLWLMLAGGPALAVQPGEQLPDPGEETRARRLSSQLRCLVCQNQSIDDSDASLARDLRLLVRERIRAGDDDGMIRAYLVARYGEFVLLRPPFSVNTLLLWGLPGLALLLGGMAAFRLFARKADGALPPLASSPPLSDDEQIELDAILAHRAEPNPGKM